MTQDSSVIVHHKNPTLTTGIWTRDLWFRSLDLRPLDPAGLVVWGRQSKK
jgi:hypothetical protein